MAWPNDPCPPNGPPAVQHLDWIKSRAQVALAQNPTLLNRILLAINACKGGICKPSGTPPTDACVHGQYVLWARCLASESNWGACADELEHGT